MNFHPIANVFPLMGKAALKELAGDIAANGLREPVWLYEGQVLDGRNRWAACELAGVKPATQEFKGDRLAALRFVWSENFHRRHLNPGQAAVAEAKRGKLDTEYAGEIEKMKAEAQERKAEGPAKGGRAAGRGRKKADSMGKQVSPSKEARRTATARARAAGLTQAAAGARAAVSRKHVCSVERGRQEPSVGVLIRLADVYGTTLDALAGRKTSAR